jgi:uncharacterized membrane protein YvbJ
MTGFFCQDCGTRVPRDAERCPSCGAAFSSVKCPKCGYSGPHRLFANGCPSCGYLKKEKTDYPVREPVKKKSSAFRYILPFSLGLLLIVLVLIVWRFGSSP